MQRHRNRLGGVRFEQNTRAVNLRARLSVLGVGRKLLLDQTVKLGSLPARFDEQPVDVRERLDASLDCLLETLRRVGLREMHRRLHGRQDVLGPVLGLASEDSDLRLVTLALGNVAGDFRRADDFAFRILDRRNGQRNIDRLPSLRYSNGFIVLDALAAPDTFENLGLLVMPVRRNQNRDRLA